MRRAWSLALAGSVLSVALAGCGSLPDAGPSAGAIERSAGRFALIDLTPDIATKVDDFVTGQRAEGPVKLPARRQPGLVGPGDLLKIVIWQPNPAGVAVAGDKPGLETDTRVGIDGTVGVPYAGRVRVAGRTPAAIEQAISAMLAAQMPNAQVAVLVTDNVANTVVVQGDVAKPGRYPVVPGSSGLLDVLAEAGGAHTPDRQTLVRVTRGGTSVTRTLSHLVETHALESDLAPGDRILVEPRQRFFYAFGAVNRPGEQPYDADDITLAHTLARLQGLSDNLADPASVFIYRRQPVELTRQIAAAPVSDPSRVIYRVNLREAGGFFVSQAFPVLPDDMIYVSDAPVAEAAKVFQVLTGISFVGAMPRNMGAPY
ncbi:MAG TPA: polysaccharide biosynthesis/export family protein [Rhodopila sp.]|nr:polysaccharide biosynthesis/export family protein [Rhodopila sp.]